MYFFLIAIIIYANILFPATNAKPLCTLKSLSDTFYIIIPSEIKGGKIQQLSSGLWNKEAATYIFSFNHDSLDTYRNRFFYLEVLDKQEKAISNLPADTLSLHQVMDSLTKHGRPFFRQNVFYAIVKSERLYVHEAKGEYLPDKAVVDDESVPDSTIRKKR